MRVLIIGARGFLGQHVRCAFEDAGARVSLAPGSRELDLAEAAPGDWDRLLQNARPDVVVNCAGLTSGSPAELARANEGLVAGLIAAVCRTGPRPRLLHLGSAAELGPTSALPVTEDQYPQPGTPYGVSKLAGTRLLLQAFARAELTGSVLRVFNPVGPGQGEGSLPGRAAALLAAAEQQGQAVVRFGPLSTSRDFIDVRDVAQAAVCLAHTDQPPALVNVARGTAVQARSLVHELARLSGFAGRIEEDADPSVRSAQVSQQRADVSRLRALGWAPHVPLKTSLQDLWSAYRAAHPPVAAAYTHPTQLNPRTELSS